VAEKVEIIITATDFASQTFKGLGNNLNKLQNSISKFGTKAKQLGSDLTTGLTLPLAALGGLSFKAAVDFESAFAGVRKTVDATEKEFKALSTGIRNMARELPASTEEIARVAEAAGQLGIKKENILSFSQTMIDLGNTTNLSSDQAATALARLSNITQLPQEQIKNLGSTIVALGNNLATTEAEITEMALRISGAAAQIGIANADILAISGALSSVGINAEAGGTAISRVMVEIAKSVDIGGEKLENFATVAGVSVDTFKQSFQTDASNAIITFIEGLGRISDEGGSVFATLQQLGLENIRVRDALLRSSGAGDLLRESLNLGRKAWQENTALTIEAGKRYETTRSQLILFWNQLKDVGITLGESLIPALMGALEAAKPFINLIALGAEKFQNLSPRVQTIIIGVTAFAAALGPVIGLIGIMASGIAALIPVVTSLAVLFSPAGLIVLAFAAAVAAGFLIVKNWDFIKEKTIELVNVIKEHLVDRFGGIVESIKEKIEQIKGFFQGMFDFLVGGSIIPEMVDLINEDFQRISDGSLLATENVKLHFQSIPPIAQQSFDQVKNIFEDWLGTFKTGLQQMQNLSKSVWQQFSFGASQAITQAIFHGENLGKAFESLLLNIAKNVIQMLIRIGIERLVQSIIFQAVNIKETTARMASLSAITFAGAFSATAQIPIIGPFIAGPVATAALAGMLAGAASAAAVGGALGAGIAAFEHGGIVTKPTVALIGEAGPEAVVPLNQAGDRGFGFSTGDLHFHFEGPIMGDRQQAKEFALMIDKELFDLKLRNQSLSLA